MKSSPLPQLHTMKHVARCLSVSEKTIQRRIQRGEIVAHHIGSQVRISDADLRAYIALHRDA